jgi:hypothetical protein
MRWKRTQMSACTYSMMWPMWNGPFAYGSAVVTNSVRAGVAGMREPSGKRVQRETAILANALFVPPDAPVPIG